MSNKKKNSEFIDIKGVLDQYLKYWYWFAISIVLCVAVSYYLVKTHPRQNVVQASILISQEDGSINMLSGLGSLFSSDAYVQDEIFVIKSHSVMAKVAKDLGINKLHFVKTGFLTEKLDYPDFPIDVTADSTVIDTLRAGLKFEVRVHKGAVQADITVKNGSNTVAEKENAKLPATIKTDYGEFKIFKTDAYKDSNEVSTDVFISGYDIAAENLATEVSTEISSKKSNVIGLSITTTNSKFGIDILNTVMDVYNRRGINDKNARAISTAEFIAERIALIGADLNEIESQIEHYKDGNRMIDLEVEAKVNTELKTEYEAKLVELQTQKEILEMTLGFLKSETNKYDMLPVVALDNGERDNTILMYNELILKRISLLSNAKPGNRSIAELDKQIDALRSTIVVAIERAIRSNSIAIKEAQAQANMAIAKLGNVPTQEREFISLKRQQEVKQQLYLFLLERAEETSMMIANAVPKGTIIDNAYVLKDMVGTSKTTALVFALILGLLLPIIGLYLRDLLRNKVNSRKDIERYLNLPVLGEICTDKSGKQMVVGSDNTSSSAELFRMLRANLQFVLSEPKDKVIMVTSSSSGEGKSFISVNLAASLALLGKKVVLIGMDIRKPQIANYLGIQSSPGVTQYLSNTQVTVNSIIQPYNPVEGLYVVVSGPIPPNPGELMTSPRVGELIDRLRQEFDYIIVDTAPVGLVSDSINLTQYVDVTILVVRDKVTRLQDLDYVNNIVEDKRLKRVSVVFNGTTSNKGYGYGYH